jgi:hypothetical protein
VKIVVYDMKERKEIAAVSCFSAESKPQITDLLKSIKRLYSKVRVEGHVADPIIVIPELPELLSYGNHNISKYEIQCVTKLQTYFKKMKLSLSSFFVVPDHTFLVEVYTLERVKKMLVKIYNAQNEQEMEALSSNLSQSCSKMSHTPEGEPIRAKKAIHHKLLRVLTVPLYNEDKKYTKCQLEKISQYILEQKLLYQYRTFMIDAFTAEDIDKLLRKDSPVKLSTYTPERLELLEEKHLPSKYLELLMKKTKTLMASMRKTDSSDDDELAKEFSSKQLRRSSKADSAKESIFFGDVIKNIAQFTLNDFDPATQYRRGLVKAEATDDESDYSARFTVDPTVNNNNQLDLSSDVISKIRSDNQIHFYSQNLGEGHDYVQEPQPEAPKNILTDCNLVLDLDYQVGSEDEETEDDVNEETSSVSNRKSKNSLRIRKITTPTKRRNNRDRKQTTNTHQIGPQASPLSVLYPSKDQRWFNSSHQDMIQRPRPNLSNGDSKDKSIQSHSRSKLLRNSSKMEAGDDSIHEMTKYFDVSSPNRGVHISPAFNTPAWNPAEPDSTHIIKLPVELFDPTEKLNRDSGHERVIQFKSVHRLSPDINSPLIFKKKPVQYLTPSKLQGATPQTHVYPEAAKKGVQTMNNLSRIPTRSIDLLHGNTLKTGKSPANFNNFKSIGEATSAFKSPSFFMKKQKPV